LIPYRAEVAAAFEDVSAPAGLSFLLECGFGPSTNLELVGDLDNLMYPIADALGRLRFVAAWGRKDAGTVSRIAVGQPVPLPRVAFSAWQHAAAKTTASASTEAWKVEIAAQIASATPLPSTGGAALVIAFRVGPGRAWHNLWKPAIDSLGWVLGPGSRTWHPRDGRIVELGLSVEVDSSIGWATELDFWWQVRDW
jgi:hypothetical protein